MAVSSSRVLRWTPPADLLLSQRGEPPLDEIDPRALRWREVDMEARMPRQPAVDQRRLVRAGVVDDEMDRERLGDGVIDRIAERAKLARSDGAGGTPR